MKLFLMTDLRKRQMADIPFIIMCGIMIGIIIFNYYFRHKVLMEERLRHGQCYAILCMLRDTGMTLPYIRENWKEDCVPCPGPSATLDILIELQRVGVVKKVYGDTWVLNLKYWPQNE